MNPITFNTTGIFNYTVPVTGTYDLSGFGAGGGNATDFNVSGGSGAGIGGTFNLTAGQQLQIVVGGVGGSSRGGGGGGGLSEVLINSGANGAFVPLLIAGGGGGGTAFGGAGGNAPLFTPANALGNGGNGGGATGGNFASGGGGAGALSPGTAGSNGTGDPTVTGGGGGSTGPSYAGGTAGAGGGTNINGAAGGFGGGGGSGGGAGAGGGGGAGATGGNGGTSLTNPSTAARGGTSYLASTGTLNAAETQAGAGVSTGNGSVRILAPAQPGQPAVPCYVTGTRIRVLRGRTVADVPVERLRVGDLAIAASGKPRPIRWIGSRSYPGLTAPKHERPVRIKASALADGIPARDLLVSPDHCLSIDGLFVAAGHLSNGASIVRGEAVRDLTYWHVELDSHDLLMAENTPAESFLAAPGVRAGFDGVSDAADAAPAPVPYAPRAERHAPEMDALRERLILRAGLSVEPTRFGAMRAWLDVCDGRRVAGWAQDEAHPDGPVCLDILVDGEIVALALAQDHRADLAAAGMGDGRHGFDIALDAPLSPGVAHTVEVRRSADGLRVAAMAVDAAGAWTALLAA